jgi:hypothetical protein
MKKNALICSLSLVAGLAVFSVEAQAADPYGFCSVTTHPVVSSGERNLVIQGNIAKMTIGDNREKREKLKAQYIDFVNQNHPSWFKGYRETSKGLNPDAKSVEFNISAAVKCEAGFESLKDAQNNHTLFVKDRQEISKRPGYGGTVEVEKNFVYKP